MIVQIVNRGHSMPVVWPHFMMMLLCTGLSQSAVLARLGATLRLKISVD